MAAACWLAFLPALLLGGCLTLQPVPDSPDNPLEYRDFALDNGLRVVLVREPKAPVVVSQVWYRVGAVDEPPGRAGLAHMLEHMMFQGTETVEPEAFSRIISRHGGDDNASTAHDYTNYWVKLGSDHLELALRLEADRMRNLVLAEAEFHSENAVVQEERRQRTDSDPEARMLERFNAEAFRIHPYGKPVIGPMDEIASHTVRDMQAFYDRYYAPNNAALIVVGDIDFDAAEALARRYFGPLPANPGINRAIQPPEPPIEAPRRVDARDPEAEAPAWYAGFHAPTLADPEAGFVDPIALEAIAEILSSSGASRLYKRLVVEEQLAVSVDAGFSALARDRDLFTISVQPRSPDQLPAVERAVAEELRRLAAEPVTGRELERVINSLSADLIYERDSIRNVAWLIGRAITSGIDWRRVMISYQPQLARLSPADLQQAAQRYLDPQHWVVGTLRPAEEGNGGGAAASLDQSWAGRQTGAEQ